MAVSEPSAPESDLRLAETQKLSDRELFWIIENGIGSTGMPGFAPPHGSQDDWKLVLFIRHLPVEPARLTGNLKSTWTVTAPGLED
jgi:hypothetical protein